MKILLINLIIKIENGKVEQLSGKIDGIKQKEEFK